MVPELSVGPARADGCAGSSRPRVPDGGVLMLGPGGGPVQYHGPPPKPTGRHHSPASESGNRCAPSPRVLVPGYLRPIPAGSRRRLPFARREQGGHEPSGRAESAAGRRRPAGRHARDPAPAGRRARRGLRKRLEASVQDPATLLPLVLIAAFVARVAWLGEPGRSLIFDEAYYVNAARVLLGWAMQPGAHYASSPPGLDPNTEHPPLGKLLIAGSMLLFGDNGIGWRVPSVIAGMVALLAVYGIARASHATPKLSVLVVALLAFDNLTLVHGRIGTLDMLFLAPILVGSWLALRKRWALAGIAMADRHPDQAARDLRRRGGAAPVPAPGGAGVVAGPPRAARGAAWPGRVRRRVRRGRVRRAVGPRRAVHHLRDAGRPPAPHGRVRRQPREADRHRRVLPGQRQPPVAVAVQRVPDPLPARRRDGEGGRQGRVVGAEDRLPRARSTRCSRAR